MTYFLSHSKIVLDLIFIDDVINASFDCCDGNPNSFNILEGLPFHMLVLKKKTKNKEHLNMIIGRAGFVCNLHVMAFLLKNIISPRLKKIYLKTTSTVTEKT